VAEALLAAGVDPKARDRTGRTPLFHVPDVDAMRLLVERGCEVNALDQNNWTALHYLCSEFSFNIFQRLACLLELGADTWAVDKNNKTPLYIANDNNNLFAIAFFGEFNNEERKSFEDTLFGGERIDLERIRQIRRQK
jgi:ankyrin repeat protein